MADTDKPETGTQPEVETTEGEHDQQAEGAKPKTLDEALAAIDKMQAALKETNAEAAKRRKALKAFEDAEAKRKQAEDEKRKTELSEADRLKQEKLEIEQRLQKQEADFKAERIKSAVERLAEKMNFHNAEQAFKLANLAEVDIEDGKVTGVEAALKALAKASPHLVKSDATDTDIDATRKSTDKTALTDDEKRELAARYGVKPEFVK